MAPSGPHLLVLHSCVIRSLSHWIGLTSATDRTCRIDGVWLLTPISVSGALSRSKQLPCKRNCHVIEDTQAAMWKVYKAKNWGLLPATSTKPGEWMHHLGSKSFSPSQAFQWLHLMFTWWETLKELHKTPGNHPAFSDSASSRVRIHSHAFLLHGRGRGLAGAVWVEKIAMNTCGVTKTLAWLTTPTPPLLTYHCLRHQIFSKPQQKVQYSSSGKNSKPFSICCHTGVVIYQKIQWVSWGHGLGSVFWGKRSNAIWLVATKILADL